MTEEINAKSGLKLLIEKKRINRQIEISLRMKSEKNCLLHWGLSPRIQMPWQIPPQAYWPEGTKLSGETALQTPFKKHNGENRILMRLDQSPDFSVVDFALFFPEEGQWDNNHGQNYHIKLPKSEKLSPSILQELRNKTKHKAVKFEHVYNLGEDSRLAVSVIKEKDFYIIYLITDLLGPLILHWGIAEGTRNKWALPPTSIRPSKTLVLDNTAAQTPFSTSKGLNLLRIKLKKKHVPLGIPFLIKRFDTDLWFKNHGHNFYIPLHILSDKQTCSESLKDSGVAKEIIQAEMDSDSWTLMHRFNLCYDLLDIVGNDAEGLALLFVWLRFSAIRQLDWQRNYNTQPRELSHALDRLTLKLSDIYINSELNSRELIRLILTTLGRGGEGQLIRDEFLNIMHRHKIKEVSGNFMEEWHQKLHNNATPDDIVICEAYLEFLKSNGNLDTFYKKLEEGKVTKKRLKNFERSIVTDPEFYKDIKEALIHDFEHYMKILKSVHSGTDLESAIDSARNLLDKKTNIMLNFIWLNRDDPSVSTVNLIGTITDVRIYLNNFLDKKWDSKTVRDLFFLDLALEEFLRTLVERNIHSQMNRDQVVDLICMVLENLNLSHDSFELSECFRHWKRLQEMPRFDKNWSLHAKSVLDRLEREIGSFIDHYNSILQPKAEFLGKALHVDLWTITLFSEEVIRGRNIFILSLLLRNIDPMLRRAANLGDWQVISPGRGMGHVKVVDKLKSIQGKTFSSPVVIIADKIMGDEEIPENVTAIISPDVTDILSHIAVRARNKHLLFATCYDAGIINHLKSLKGRFLNITVSPSGKVVTEKGMGDKNKIKSSKYKIQNAQIVQPDLTFDAISLENFNKGLVGSKSNNLKHLKNKLPDWIHLPFSVALPFGALKKLLTEPHNKGIAKQYQGLIRKIDENPGRVLAEIQELLLTLEPSKKIVSSLQKIMDNAGLKSPENWDNAWKCIKRVWASKWNERAFLNRKAAGIPNDALFMAVLIQEVIKAEYAFVIHTSHPYMEGSNELYAELVLGLGETLVGNYPGRALSFTSNKNNPEPQILAYPSKSVGLFGSGLIFRSDSNGEDLSGYAGAGLYDSVMLELPREIPLDYTKEPLLWDEDFRREFLINITKIGLEVENAFGGCPQDIEGAYSNGQYFVVQTRPQVGLKEYGI